MISSKYHSVLRIFSLQINFFRLVSPIPITLYSITTHLICWSRQNTEHNEKMMISMKFSSEINACRIRQLSYDVYLVIAISIFDKQPDA